jgi:hypothetical protein
VASFFYSEVFDNFGNGGLMWNQRSGDAQSVQVGMVPNYRLNDAGNDLVAQVPNPDVRPAQYETIFVPNATVVGGKALSNPLVWDKPVFSDVGGTILGYGIAKDFGYNYFTRRIGATRDPIRQDLWPSIVLLGAVFMLNSLPFAFIDFQGTGPPANGGGPDPPYETWDARRIITHTTWDAGAAGWFDLIDA